LDCDGVDDCVDVNANGICDEDEGSLSGEDDPEATPEPAPAPAAGPAINYGGGFGGCSLVRP
jgi:hypothetical protein